MFSSPLSPVSLFQPAIVQYSSRPARSQAPPSQPAAALLTFVANVAAALVPSTSFNSTVLPHLPPTHLYFPASCITIQLLTVR